MRASPVPFRNRQCWATSVYRSAESSPSSQQSWKVNGNRGAKRLRRAPGMGDVGPLPECACPGLDGHRQPWPETVFGKRRGIDAQGTFSANQWFDGYRVWLGTGAEREACLRASCSVVILYAK